MHVNARALIERQSPEGKQVLVQMRNKPMEGSPTIELPGGRVEEFESLIDALRREVREETGLELTVIEGLETRIETNGISTQVECLQPFAVYQILHGPVDSMGVYFRCQAEGRLLEAGDDSAAIRWVSIQEISQRLQNDVEQFSWVDRAGLLFYLQITRTEKQSG